MLLQVSSTLIQVSSMLVQAALMLVLVHSRIGYSLIGYSRIGYSLVSVTVAFIEYFQRIDHLICKAWSASNMRQIHVK